MIKPSYYYVHILIGMHNELTQCTFTFISLESLQLSSLHSQTIQICTFPKKKSYIASQRWLSGQSTCCSLVGLFRFLASGCSESSVIPFVGDPKASSDLCGHSESTHTHMQAKHALTEDNKVNKPFQKCNLNTICEFREHKVK